MTPEQRWNGPIQDAIKRHDEQQAAPQIPGTLGQPVNRVDWFRRAPGGGTVWVRPQSQQPEGHGAKRPEEVVELPEEES